MAENGKLLCRIDNPCVLSTPGVDGGVDTKTERERGGYRGRLQEAQRKREGVEGERARKRRREEREKLER